jgi:hypothetical protein
MFLVIQPCPNFPSFIASHGGGSLRQSVLFQVKINLRSDASNVDWGDAEFEPESTGQRSCALPISYSPFLLLSPYCCHCGHRSYILQQGNHMFCNSMEPMK